MKGGEGMFAVMRVESGDDVVVLDDAHDGHKNTIVVVIQKGGKYRRP